MPVHCSLYYVVLYYVVFSKCEHSCFSLDRGTSSSAQLMQLICRISFPYSPWQPQFRPIWQKSCKMLQPSVPEATKNTHKCTHTHFVSQLCACSSQAQLLWCYLKKIILELQYTPVSAKSQVQQDPQSSPGVYICSLKN